VFLVFLLFVSGVSDVCSWGFRCLFLMSVSGVTGVCFLCFLCLFSGFLEFVSGVCRVCFCVSGGFRVFSNVSVGSGVFAVCF